MIRLEEIGATPARQPAVTLDQPLEHLLACHRRIEQRLAVLKRAAEHLEDQPAEALEAIRNCFRFLDSNGQWHTADEEESIFPRLRGRIEKQQEAFLSTLESDHQKVERVYRDLKDHLAATPPPPLSADAAALAQNLVAQLCDLYRKHIATEDATLIAIARTALDDAQLAAISREMKARRTAA